MRKAMCCFAVLALLAAPAAAAQVKTRPLFIIERSKNANVVHYDARLTADGLTGPKVEYIELYGKDLKTGGKRYQKIVPK